MQYDDTNIYQRCMELIYLASRLMKSWPPGYAFLSDQLKRAVSSIALNFAEGYGRQTKREQRRYFVMARGSASEVAAILDIGFRFGIVEQDDHEKGRDICDHLARMLTKFRR